MVIQIFLYQHVTILINNTFIEIFLFNACLEHFYVFNIKAFFYEYFKPICNVFYVLSYSKYLYITKLS